MWIIASIPFWFLGLGALIVGTGLTYHSFTKEGAFEDFRNGIILIIAAALILPLAAMVAS